VSKKVAKPQSRHHLWLFDEDWEYLSRRLLLSDVTPGQFVRALLHRHIQMLRAREEEEEDARDSAISAAE